MPLRITALTASSQPAATAVTHAGSAARDSATSNSVAVAAGTVPETMNTADATSNAHPAKKPSVGLNTRLTHAYEAPAFGSVLFRCMKASATPNIINPQYKILVADKTQTVSTKVVVVAATLNAGAVPATPITTDSAMPNAPSANLLCSLIFNLIPFKKEMPCPARQSKAFLPIILT